MSSSHPPGPATALRLVEDRSLARALNREWAELVDRPQPAVVAWADRHPALAGCRELSEVLVRVRDDAVLLALVRESLGGSALAGRTVLQGLLGRLVQLADRDRSATVDDYVAAFWIVLAHYPLRARPSRVAANLVLDTLKQVHSERDGGPGGGTVIVPGERLARLVEARRLAGPQEPEPDASSLIEAALLLRLIDEPTGQLLRRVYVDGLPGAVAARLCGTTHGSLRVRCHRAVGRLAAASDLLRDAA